jgi:hypothetical protein
MKPDYQPNPYTLKRPRRGLALVAAVVVLIVIAMAWGTQRNIRGGDPARRATGESPAAVPDEVGTTGASSGDHAVAHSNSGPPAVVPPAALQSFAALSRAGNPEDLVGRRVELQITAHDIANDIAFWVGEGPDRMLAVTGRDTRDERQRQTGAPSDHRIQPVRAGERVTISGTVQRLPHAEAMYSWGLSNQDAAALREKYVYLRIDRVTPVEAS